AATLGTLTCVLALCAASASTHRGGSFDPSTASGWVEIAVSMARARCGSACQTSEAQPERDRVRSTRPTGRSIPLGRTPMSKRRRVLLKLSGEAFGAGSLGVNPDVIAAIAREIAEA